MSEPEAKPEAGYRVLARKYRPQVFDDLIGQEAMVRTLANGFAANRIAQAYMLTGVRGIGKTTTARLIARALNYTGPGGENGPSISMPVLAEHCEAILESRHPDVIEMDAASRTGIDDVREIIEAVRYKPISARYKVYIIDEVHMLSKQAFNALLKTLEEPPDHVKFIFATTEIRKVPVTVLSRCQRFDLRRLDAALLMKHFGNVAAKEGVTAEEGALRLIARAAEGSVRDGLSLLDQAIAHGGERVSEASVQDMLGLADRARIIDLFADLMKGDAAAALSGFETQLRDGGDPVTVLTDLADFVHWVTRLKVAPASAADPARTEAERSRGLELAQGLPMPALTRAWQLLLKGFAEVKDAANAAAAAEMVLIRIAYAASLPSTEDLVRHVRDQQRAGAAAGAASGLTPSPMARPAAPVAAAPEGATRMAGALALKAEAAGSERMQAGPQAAAIAGPANLRELVAFVGERRDIKLKSDIERFLRPIHIEPGRIELALERGAPPNFANELARKLEGWTGRRWMVSLARDGGGPTLAEEARAQRDSRMTAARQNPAVAALLKAFPGAEIAELRAPEAGLGDEMPERDERDDD